MSGSLAALGLLAATGVVFAQTQAASRPRLQFPVGPMVAYPIAGVSAGYSTNVLDEQGDETGSWAILLRLGAGLQGERRGHLYGVEYLAEAGRYASAPDDDFIDQRLTGYWGHAFDLRNNLELGAEYVKGHDPRGEEDPTLGSRHSRDAAEPDTWDLGQAGGTYTFGAPGARGRFELGTCWTCLRYTNNDQDFRDRDLWDLGATLYARVAPKTYGLAQVIYSDFDYTNQRPEDLAAGQDLDSTERRYLAGVQWDATAKTTGSLRFGWLEKDFSGDSERESYGDYTWALDVNWVPRVPDQFQLGFNRGVYEKVFYSDDPEENDDFVVVEQLEASWSHQWGSRLSSAVSGYRGWDEYEPTGREDDRYGATARLSYTINRWASVGLGYWYLSRDSSLPEHDYRDQGFTLDFNVGGLLGLDARARRPCALGISRGPL